MSAARSFFDAIAANRRKRAAEASEEDDTICVPCQGTGLTDGPDGAPCQYCDGSGVW